MLRAGLARAEKIAEFDRAHLAAGGRIGLVQDERAAIVVSAEQPPVTIFTVIDFSLVIGHLGLRAKAINHDPDLFRAKSDLRAAARAPQAEYWLNRQISPRHSLSADRPGGEAVAALGAFFGWLGRIDTRPKFQPRSGWKMLCCNVYRLLSFSRIPILFSQRKRTVDLANKNRLPAMYFFRDLPRRGKSI